MALHDGGVAHHHLAACEFEAARPTLIYSTRLTDCA
jgi:hypothetical protein